MVLKMDILSFILGICVMYLVQKVYALYKIPSEDEHRLFD